MIDMFIPGEPAPGGSKTALPMRNRKYPGVCNHYLHKDGRLVLNYKDNGGSRKDPVTGKNDIGAGNREWRAAVEMGTKRRYCAAPLEGPLRVLFRFMVRRPQGQHVANDRARPVREDHQHLIGPIVAPDLTKYIRSTEDALTDAGLWRDDSQVVQQYAEKVYAASHEPEGCRIMVTRCIADHAPAALFTESAADQAARYETALRLVAAKGGIIAADIARRALAGEVLGATG